MLPAFPTLQFWLARKERSQNEFRRLKVAQTKLAKALASCIFTHGDTIRTRDEEGYLALQCVDCGQMRRVLDQPPIKGPKLHAAPVKGAPVAAAKRVAQERTYPRLARVDASRR